VSGDDLTLREATQRWLADVSTREVPVRATLAPMRTPDERAHRALSALERLGETEALVVGDAIGEGGMSVVRRGRQVALGREVAVKTLRHHDADERATLRMLREAWVTGSLEHPNIVPVHDIHIDPDGRPQIVLKRIGGRAWSVYMHDERALREQLGVRDALDWNIRTLMQVCNAVHFAHTRGVLHRDLKSDNVMIGEFGEVYVLDWGLAVSLTDDATGRLPLAVEVDSIDGTPAYMAPEMLDGNGARLSTRTDVYLLGGVLFEILTSWPPHMAGSMREIVASVVRSEPDIPEGTPDELAGIVRKALAARPEDRFESAEVLRLALSAFLEHRASVVLAEDALAKLRDLEVACAEAQERTRSDERGQRRDLLFGECRFGFREALRAWPGNTLAAEGLRRAVVLMTEVELAQGDPRTAALLVSELRDPPEELAARVKRARAAQREEDERLARLARDQDPAIGRRVRLLVSVSLGIVWTALRGSASASNAVTRTRTSSRRWCRRPSCCSPRPRARTALAPRSPVRP